MAPLVLHRVSPLSCVTGSHLLPYLPPCLPCILPYPSSPVLLMACRPCRGAGRIWCCRSHKVRPPGVMHWVPAPLQAHRGLCRALPVHACAWCVPHWTHTDAVIPRMRLDPHISVPLLSSPLSSFLLGLAALSHHLHACLFYVWQTDVLSRFWKRPRH